MIGSHAELVRNPGLGGVVSSLSGGSRIRSYSGVSGWVGNYELFEVNVESFFNSTCRQFFLLGNWP